jgi:glycosyltransferase involved in cell wall biosynthesis
LHFCSGARAIAAMLPKISIVVPNYNGAKTLARTLQSLVDQAYPDLEIIVIDGASTDGSVAVIRQFESHVACWASEKDRGQTDAINKGIARATGEVLNWLCSDDILLPGALLRVGAAFARQPQVDVVVGRGRHVSANRLYVASPCAEKIALMPSFNPVSQPACFYRRALLRRNGPCDESCDYAMDFELWNYFVSQRAHWAFLDDELSEALESDGNKTSTGGRRIARELERIYRRYSRDRVPMYWWYRTLKVPLRRRRRSSSTLVRLLARLALVPVDQVMSLAYGRKKWRGMNWDRFYNQWQVF